MCLPHMPATLATNLVSSVMTSAVCHSPAVQTRAHTHTHHTQSTEAALWKLALLANNLSAAC